MEPVPHIDATELRRLATRIRLNATRMVAIQRLGYLCQAMSSAEIFAVLFGGGVIRAGYDRFILSPGLCVPKIRFCNIRGEGHRELGRT